MNSKSEHNRMPYPETNASAPIALSNGVGRLSRHLVSLGDLQWKLFVLDVRSAARGILTAAVLGIVSGVLITSSIILALAAFAAWLTMSAGLSLAASLAISSILGVTLAGISVAILLWVLRSPSVHFKDTLEELRTNAQWLRTIVNGRESQDHGHR